MAATGFSVSLDDLYTAYVDCRKKKKNKRGSKKFEPNALYSLKVLQKEINEGRYRLSQAQCFVIKQPTVREVFCANFRDRIVQHFVFNELNPIIEKMLVYDAANCRVGKGTDFAVKRVTRFVRSASDNYSHNSYCLKMDLSGFFMRIDRDRLCDHVLSIVETDYKGPYQEVLCYLIPILIKTDITVGATRLSPKSDWDILPERKTLFNNSHGLPIGNLCSQLFANLYLNDLDHVIKSRHRYYSRYVDDMIIIDNDKQALLETKAMVVAYLKSLNMILNEDKTRVFPTSYGVPYLGIDIHHHYNALGKRKIKRLYQSSMQFRSAEEAYTSSSSRRGMFLRYHGKRLMFRWYRTLPLEIRKDLRLESTMRLVLLKERRKDTLHDLGLMLSECELP